MEFKCKGLQYLNAWNFEDTRNGHDLIEIYKRIQVLQSWIYTNYL